MGFLDASHVSWSSAVTFSQCVCVGWGVLCYQHHSYVITVLLFQHLFQTQYLMFYSTYQRATPLLTTAWALSPNSSNLQSVFSFHRDKLCVCVCVCVCVWINIVDIKPNLCLYTSSTANSSRFIRGRFHKMLNSLFALYLYDQAIHE